MKINVCPSLLEPQEIEVPSSSPGVDAYVVITPTLLTDGLCDCKDYQYRGEDRECKHITKAAEEYVCVWGSADPADTHCPICGKEAISVIIPNGARPRRSA